MTKKKNLKFKVGDRVRLVGTATYGPKGDAVVSSGGAKIGELYYIVEDYYQDGDYDLGTEDTKKYVTDTFVGVVHQRHLELAETGDAIESFNTIAIDIAQPSLTRGLQVGDVVALKDGVTEPYFTGESGHRFNACRIHADQRYRVNSVIQGRHSTRVRLGRLSGVDLRGDIAVVDADFLELILTKLQVETIGQPEPAWKPFTWHDVEVGDKVTARSNIRTIGASMDSEIVHTEIAHRQDHGWNGSDLYWKDLNLTVHRDFDSWTIMNITKAKDLPKPEPKPLDQRRKYQPVQVRRTKSTDGLWLEHEVRTGQKAGVVEQQTAIHTNHGYWVFFADGSKLKLIDGRDKVFVAGQQRDYDDAQGKTHTPD